jgi:hypothetical protein
MSNGNGNEGNNSLVNFYPEISGPETAEFNYVSGIRLRQILVTRKKIEYLNVHGYDAFELDPVLEANKIAEFKAESWSRFPYEGNYLVRFLNPDGSFVTDLGGEAIFQGELPPAYCNRPTTLLDCKLYSQAGTIPVDFTGSFQEACDALTSGDPLDFLTRIGMQTPAFFVGNHAYTETGTDCSTVPDGWYICNYIVSFFVIQILGGKINDLPVCSTPL